MLPTALAIAALVWIAALTVVVNERHRRHDHRMRRARDRVARSEPILRSLYARRVEADLLARGQRPTFGVEFRSQHAEDIYLYELFSGQPTGFFIEVGAFDGYSHAVTYALEAAGWRGLLVEPLPGPAETARRCRPNSRVVQAALSRAGSTGTATFTQFPPDRTTDELRSYLATDPGRAILRPDASKGRTLEVPLTTLDDLLASHHGRIDLAVIDVEGGELNLLDGFDLRRWRPRVLLIEDHELTDDSPIGRHLLERGYHDAGWFEYNRLLVHESEPALLTRAKDLLYASDNGSRPPAPAPNNAADHSPGPTAEPRLPALTSRG